MSNKGEWDWLTVLLLGGGAAFLLYKLNKSETPKQVSTPASFPVPNPQALPVSVSHITPIESAHTHVNSPVEKAKPGLPPYIFGWRMNATQPFEIGYSYTLDGPATKVGNNYLIGINNPETLTVFINALTNMTKNAINDTSLIERANPVVQAKLEEIVSSYIMGNS